MIGFPRDENFYFVFIFIQLFVYFHPIPVNALTRLAKPQCVGGLFIIVTINSNFYPYNADRMGCLKER